MTPKEAQQQAFQIAINLNLQYIVTTEEIDPLVLDNLKKIVVTLKQMQQQISKTGLIR